MLFSRRLILRFKHLCILTGKLNFAHLCYSSFIAIFLLGIYTYDVQHSVNSRVKSFMPFSSMSVFVREDFLPFLKLCSGEFPFMFFSSRLILSFELLCSLSESINSKKNIIFLNSAFENSPLCCDVAKFCNSQFLLNI